MASVVPKQEEMVTVEVQKGFAQCALVPSVVVHGKQYFSMPMTIGDKIKFCCGCPVPVRWVHSKHDYFLMQSDTCLSNPKDYLFCCLKLHVKHYEEDPKKPHYMGYIQTYKCCDNGVLFELCPFKGYCWCGPFVMWKVYMGDYHKGEEKLMYTTHKRIPICPICNPFLCMEQCQFCMSRCGAKWLMYEQFVYNNELDANKAQKVANIKWVTYTEDITTFAVDETKDDYAREYVQGKENFYHAFMRLALPMMYHYKMAFPIPGMINDVRMHRSSFNQMLESVLPGLDWEGFADL